MRKHTDPARPAIPIRRPNFKFKSERARRWHRNSVTTLMSHALSPLFPAGERFFIRSVLACREMIQDPKLLEEARNFAAQEAVHTAEHIKYDAAVQAHYDLKTMERWTDFGLSQLSQLFTRLDGKLVNKKRIELAITAGLEHFTALLGHQLLTHPDMWEGVDPEFAALWNWHAVEEIEHKAVAFDVYEAVGGNYFERVSVFAAATVGIYFGIFMNISGMLYKDGELLDPRAWWEIFRFYVIEPGMFRKASAHYRDYFKPGFHPWDHDNRELIEDFKRRYPNIEAAQAS